MKSSPLLGAMHALPGLDAVEMWRNGQRIIPFRIVTHHQSIGNISLSVFGCLLLLCAIPQTALAQSLQQRVAALETTVDALQNQLTAAQIEIVNLQSELSNTLGKNSVGNLQLQEQIELGDAARHTGGSLTIKGYTGARALQATSAPYRTSASIVLGNSGRGNTGDERHPMDIDLAVRDPFNTNIGYSSAGNALFFDASTSQLTIGSGNSPQEGGTSGEIFLRRSKGGTTLWLNGANGDAMQGAAGNGLVRAWAAVNRDGTVASCYRCLDSGSFRYERGQYLVDFSPVSTDVQVFLSIATLFRFGQDTATTIYVANPAGFPNHLMVLTYDKNNSFVDAGFSIVVF